jgi:hypothetical protein
MTLAFSMQKEIPEVGLERATLADLMTRAAAGMTECWSLHFSSFTLLVSP